MREPFVRRSLAVVALVASVLLVLGLVYAIKAATSSDDAPGPRVTQPKQATAPKVGAPAPDFRGMDLDGRPVSLADHAGQPLWLLFQATWCSVCRAELPDVEAAADRIDVVAVYLREDRERVRDYSERLGLTLRSVPDPIGEISLSYLATSVPTHVFIDADGTIASIQKGALSPAEIEEQLAALGVGESAGG